MTATTSTTTMTTAAAAAEELVSEFDRLTISSSSPLSSSNNDALVVVPRLEQFFQLGILLFEMTATSGNTATVAKATTSSSSSTTTTTTQINDVVIAYEHFINVLPCSILQKVMTTLNEAIETFLLQRRSQQRSSTLATPIGNANANDNNDDDLIRISKSVAGLFNHSKRLCRVTYSTKWVSTLASLYDVVLVNKQTTRPPLPSPSPSSSSMSTPDIVLSCISSLLLDGLLLMVDDDDDDDVKQGKEHARDDEGGGGRAAAAAVEEEDVDPIEERILEAIQTIEDKSVDCLRDVQQWQSSQYERAGRTASTIEEAVQNLGTRNDNNDDDDAIQQQREYILNILESSRNSVPATAAATKISTSKYNGSTAASSRKTNADSTTRVMDELDRRVQQVKQILPHFGEGFIETALSLNSGDVEATVSMLLLDKSQYPGTLQVMDPALPRRRRAGTTSAEEASVSAEARKIVKERVALEEQNEVKKYKALLYVSSQQQQQAKSANLEDDDDDDDNVVDDIIEDMTSFKVRSDTNGRFEYDDDYDDQYDELDIRLGDADDGFMLDGGAGFGNSNRNKRDDFEQIKLFNQIAREDEAEQSFWDESRNTNRRAPGGGGGSGSRRTKSDDEDDDDDEDNQHHKQYRGPDKIRGGRVIGSDGKVVRNTGGNKKKNRNTNSSTTTSSSSSGGRGGGRGRGEGGSNGGRGGRGGVGRNSNSSSNNTNGDSNINNNSNSSTTHRTKPKSSNRVNRQRDKKQSKQGTFGVQG